MVINKNKRPSAKKSVEAVNPSAITTQLNTATARAQSDLMPAGKLKSDRWPAINLPPRYYSQSEIHAPGLCQGFL
jgi:hypothetical protein